LNRKESFDTRADSIIQHRSQSRFSEKDIMTNTPLRKKVSILSPTKCTSVRRSSGRTHSNTPNKNLPLYPIDEFGDNFMGPEKEKKSGKGNNDESWDSSQKEDDSPDRYDKLHISESIMGDLPIQVKRQSGSIDSNMALNLNADLAQDNSNKINVKNMKNRLRASVRVQNMIHPVNHPPKAITKPSLVKRRQTLGNSPDLDVPRTGLSNIPVATLLASSKKKIGRRQSMYSMKIARKKKED
jgi:hypothetical protein